MSYGVNGARPATAPIEPTTTLEPVVNIKSAALGLARPAVFRPGADHLVGR